MQLVWRKRAQDDRKHIARHIMEKGGLQASLDLDAQFVAKAETTINGIIRHKPGRLHNTFEIVVQANYIIVYRVKKTQITILRVLHARQQFPS